MKPTWILKDCDEGALENILNDLDHGGYVSWNFDTLMYRITHKTPNLRKVVRILARRKWVSEQLPK